MIIKRTELYNLVSKLCNGEYAIGLHGIDYDRLDKLVGINHEDAVDNIFNKGLEIFHARSINGTVNFFGRIDIEEDKEKVMDGLNTYCFGSNDYIIVVVPTILKTEKGDKLFLGSPNLDTIYKEYLDTTGNERSTLLEEYIVGDDFIVKPQYILGSFKVLGNNNIDFYANKKHICFNNGYVTQEYYDKMKRKVEITLSGVFKINGISTKSTIFENIDDINIKEIDDIVKILEQDREFSTCETLRQLANEQNLTKRTIEDIDYKVEDKVFDKNIESEQITVFLNRGQYYNSYDEYYIEFKYPSLASTNTIMRLMSELLYNYGSVSDFCYKNHKSIRPYLVDENNNFTVEGNIVGGTNIPDIILHNLIKDFVEKYRCTIICNDISMKDKFSEEKYNLMIECLELDKNKKSKK